MMSATVVGAATTVSELTVPRARDMVVAVEHSEHYRDPASGVQMQDLSAGWRPPGSGDPVDTYSFMTDLFAAGIHGQFIWIDPPTRSVTVKLSSCPEPVTEVWNRVHASLFADVSAALEEARAPSADPLE